MNRNILRASLLALSLGLAAGVSAAPDTAKTPDASIQGKRHDGARQGGKHHGGNHHGGNHHRAGAMMIPGLGPVSKAQIDALKLNDSQKQLLDQAREAQRDLFKNHAQGAGMHALLDKQLAEGKLDPRALLAESDTRREQARAQMQQARGKWLAVWDSLNDAQRGQVAGMVKEHHAKMKARMEKAKERMKERGKESRKERRGSSGAPKS